MSIRTRVTAGAAALAVTGLAAAVAAVPAEAKWTTAGPGSGRASAGALAAPVVTTAAQLSCTGRVPTVRLTWTGNGAKYTIAGSYGNTGPARVHNTTNGVTTADFDLPKFDAGVRTASWSYQVIGGIGANWTGPGSTVGQLTVRCPFT